MLTALFDAESGGDPWLRASIEERELFERSGLFDTSVAVPHPVRCEHDLAGIQIQATDVARHESFAVVRAPLPRPLLDALQRYCREFAGRRPAAADDQRGPLRGSRPCCSVQSVACRYVQVKSAL